MGQEPNLLPEKLRLLLISNSTQFGGSFLDHCASEIQAVLAGIQTVLFVPFAGHDLDAYARQVTQRFVKMGIEVTSVHESQDPIEAVRTAAALFVGGGNTFRLLARLYSLKLIAEIRARVLQGMPYIGASAGANVACATIQTTNDMPIVYPPSLAALGLLPFNINPHFLDQPPSSTHMGEPRATRIREFHQENQLPVVGLREGAAIRVENGHAWVTGIADARVFLHDEEPREIISGSSLDFLLQRVNL